MQFPYHEEAEEEEDLEELYAGIPVPLASSIESFALLEESARSLEELQVWAASQPPPARCAAILAPSAPSLQLPQMPRLQLHSYKEVVPVQLGAFTGLKRLLISVFGGSSNPQAPERLGQALAQLPHLEALSLALGNRGLAPVEAQRRLWGAWHPPPLKMRRCGEAWVDV